MTSDARYKANNTGTNTHGTIGGELTVRMTMIDPLVVPVPDTTSVIANGSPTDCVGRVRERSRLEWWLRDGGDPADLVERFLGAVGLGLTDPAAHDPATGSVCGAVLYLSGAAGAAMIGGATGAASPAPAVPDLVIVVYEHGDPGVPVVAGGWDLGTWRGSWTPGEHASAVRAVREAIGRGDAYQVNIVGHQSAPYRGDPVPALCRVAALSGASYAGVLRGDGWALACASPETLVEVTGDRVLTRPIKGTRPATDAGRAELLASDKERAEHVMIVDLERNDLARVARTGTVAVDRLFALRRWCDLWQAESTVSARLLPGVGLAGLLRAVCPGGSVTGAPKRAALDLLCALEPVGRGPSMGGYGWVGHGRLNLGLTIRTVAADGQRLHLWAGGGITWGSDPDAEVAEAAAKAGPLRAALAGRNPGGCGPASLHI
jgi:para-aminobenzoate synthetase component 1